MSDRLQRILGEVAVAQAEVVVAVEACRIGREECIAKYPHLASMASWDYKSRPPDTP